MSNSSPSVYTAITFAPVQGFIEKSRKLRDLYGSSYLLSYMARSICLGVEQFPGCQVVSPALANVTQGMPNQIIVRGQVAATQKESEAIAKQFLDEAWQLVVTTCQTWIEEQLGNQRPSTAGWRFFWNRNWQLWGNHTWEFFLAQGQPGESITEVRQRLNERKRSRAWTGVNWQGESSTLSGSDAVAFPGMGREVNPKRGYSQQKDIQSYFEQLTQELERQGIINALNQNNLLKGDRIQTEQDEIRTFYKHLSLRLGETFAKRFNLPVKNKDRYGEPFIDPREELSIPELTKRLITHRTVVDTLSDAVKAKQPCLVNQQLSVAIEELAREIDQDLSVESFRELNRLPERNGQPEPVYWTGWFMGDGDGASDYLKQLGQQGIQIEDTGTTQFSELMRQWGREFKDNQRTYLPDGQGRVVYAGGDDFLGVLYNPDQQIPAIECLNWFSTFKSKIWNGIGGTAKPITPSVGFVWAGPSVPQREVLQHCREAEKAAKSHGKDRIAFRILFNSGNHLEWICPWWLLEERLMEAYRDRSHGQNWTHFYNDVAVLESRHAFQKGEAEVALALFDVYFPGQRSVIEQHLWDSSDFVSQEKQAGVLANISVNGKTIQTALNEWIINLAKVGFYLHRDY
ncbi:Cas10/Cmr2 second palm domain-containing protein [Pantanalinema rosaneae CENA516]|uniref:Cas10/Cmr2 second palm domain-containing protein n=1 Tax=Pantanalinema rosaneae TaxID=1620701 RepID=UPI003D6DB71A